MWQKTTKHAFSMFSALIKVKVYGTHKLMLMIPESQYLKDKHTFCIVTLYFRYM